MEETNTPPEILLVTRPLTPPWDEASKNFAYQLAKNLDNFKFHILVGEYDPHLPKRITQHVIYSGSSWTTLQKTKLVLKLYLLLKKNPNIDVVHFLFAPTPFNTRVLRNLVSSFPVKVVQTVACVPEDRKEKIKSLLFADKFVVYSNYTSSRLKSIKKKLAVIPPFIDFSEFPAKTKKQQEAARRKWKMEKNDKIILYPGEYSRLGAMDTILEGFTKIRKRLPEAKLFMACRIKKRGDENIERKFKKDISLAGLSSSVYFLGKVDNIRELYVASDLTIFPVSSMDCKFDFPFVLLESLSSGTPIITSDVAALPEIWNGDKKYLNKFVYPDGNAETFAKKCVWLLNRGGNISAKDLSKFVANRFDKNSILKKYSSLYSSYK